MKGNQANRNKNINQDSIDIIHIIKNIWKERKLITKITLCFFIIGFIVALSSPISYTSETTFVPQVSDDQISTSNNNRLGSLASLAGIKINQTETSDTYLSPYLYIKIIDSEEFSLKLLDAELIDSNAKKFAVREYLLSTESSLNFNLLGFIKKYTVGLFLNPETTEVDKDIFKNYNFINSEDYSLIKLFRSKFRIELNEKQGYIKVIATDEMLLSALN